MSKKQKKTTPKTKDQKASQQNSAICPVIALGASAGGLEALELFFQNSPRELRAAYIVIQHLDPNHQSLLPGLLAKVTPMQVVEIVDGTELLPYHVYVIPPGASLTIENQTLKLEKITNRSGIGQPINTFFQSLAINHKDYAIAVILSGMGSDGSAGIETVKKHGGGAFSQSIESAVFDSMPKSAIDLGILDAIAPAEELPAEIEKYLKDRLSQEKYSEGKLSKDNITGLEKVVAILRRTTNHDFAFYKSNTLFRRIERRMSLHQIDKISDYVALIQDSPEEATLLFKEMLIGVTSFFRDPEVWELLKDKGFPSFFKAYPNGANLRAWVPACSTGEEAYTLAMVFKEALSEANVDANFSLQIYATDLDEDAINKARLSTFPESIKAEISANRLHRFFNKDDSNNYVLVREIRDMVIFAPHNLMTDPPFTKLDIITCRNLLIYFVPELQKKLIPLFHYALNPGGLLMLGSAETIGQASDLFSQFSVGKNRLFQRTERRKFDAEFEFPSVFANAPIDENLDLEISKSGQRKPPNLQLITEQLLLREHCPAAVLVTSQGDILYVSGKTGRYLEPAAGKANWNVFAMARDGLRAALNECFFKAIREQESTILRSIKINAGDNEAYMDLAVHPLRSQEQLKGMAIIVFGEVQGRKMYEVELPLTDAESPRLEKLAEELQRSHEELQSTREEMQSSQEELKSTNEELQSSNEELQSTNEELTTSKEEMQSMNEELQTVNHELQAKVDELSQASNDMKNLLNSTDIATLFLDEGLCVRRFTTKTTQIIKLIQSDIGRPITDLSSHLDYPEFIDDVHQVLETLVYVEREVKADDECTYLIRIMPYRTHDNRIDGVVITFADITIAKKLEAQLKDSRIQLEAEIESKDQEIEKLKSDRNS